MVVALCPGRLHNLDCGFGQGVEGVDEGVELGVSVAAIWRSRAVFSCGIRAAEWAGAAARCGRSHRKRGAGCGGRAGGSRAGRKANVA